MAPDCYQDRFTFVMAALSVNIFHRPIDLLKCTDHRLTIFPNGEI